MQDEVRRFLLPKGDDAWLYNRETLEWVSNPGVIFDAPLHVRAALEGLALQFPLWGPVFGAQALVSLLRNLPEAASRAKFDVDGLTVHVDLRDARFLQVPNELLGRTRVAKSLPSFLSTGALFVDVGANYGSMSALAARCVGPSGKVVAIEPNPLIGAPLARTLQECGAPHRLHRVACGTEAGSATMFIPASSGAGSLVSNYASGKFRRFAVQVRTLDSLLAAEPVRSRSVLKIDVEGFEVDALLGARASFERLRPTLLMEINPEALEARGIRLQMVQETLEALGYADFEDLSSGRFQPLSSLNFERHADIVLVSSADSIPSA
jgi:FkbM family methyltransferase